MKRLWMCVLMVALLISTAYAKEFVYRRKRAVTRTTEE